MKKKLWTLALAAAMTLNLMACGQSQADSQASGESSAAAQLDSGDTQASDTAGASESAYAEAEAHVIWAFPTLTGAPEDLADVQDAVNEILIPKTGVEVELVISDFGSYSSTMTTALAGGEQFDIISTLNMDYPTLVNQGYLLDLEADNLMQENGAEIYEAVEEAYLNACRINGSLYGLPGNRDYAQGRFCMIFGKSFLDGIGYEPPADAGEIIPITLEELENIMAQLHEAYPDVEVFRPASGDFGQYTNIDLLGGNNFGVLENYGQGTQVVNLFETEDYRAFCELMYSWNQAGYISKDAATDDTSTPVLVKAGTTMSYLTAGKPGIKVQEELNCGTEVLCFQIRDDFISSSGVTGWTNAIPYTTGNAQAAMKVLQEIYTNPEIADLVVYGIENVHYVIDEDGLLDSSSAERSGKYATLGWLYPNEYITTVTSGNRTDLWEAMADFNNNAIQSAALGFSFDTSSVLTEFAECTNKYNEYSKQLEFGFVDPDIGIAELAAELDSAGIDKIIAEKQSQLDAWLAAR